MLIGPGFCPRSQTTQQVCRSFIPSIWNFSGSRKHWPLVRAGQLKSSPTKCSTSMVLLCGGGKLWLSVSMPRAADASPQKIGKETEVN